MGGMKYLLISAALLLASCQISPVIQTPMEGPGERYRDCRRAARDYCRDVAQVAEEDQKRCISEATFECVSEGDR